MTIAEIARDFAHLCRTGREAEAAARYNAPDIVSIEAMESPFARCVGAEQLAAKWAWWTDNHIVHSIAVEGPFVHGEQFALVFAMDYTRKQDGERGQSSEVALYTVREGKVAEERFFY